MSSKYRYRYSSRTIQAATLPSFLTIFIPVFVFLHFFLDKEYAGIRDLIEDFDWGWECLVSFFVMFILLPFPRIIGKDIFEKRAYTGEHYLPVTQFLLYSDNEYENDYKNQVRMKIKSDFGIELYDKEMEITNELQARNKIASAIRHIRSKVSDSKPLAKYNIEYRTYRNTLGGSFLGLLFSLVNLALLLYVHPDKAGAWLSGVMALLYLVLLIQFKSIIISGKKKYARIMIKDYMGRW